MRTISGSIASALQLPELLVHNLLQKPIALPDPVPPAVLHPRVGADRFAQGEEILLANGARRNVSRDGVTYQLDRGTVSVTFRYDRETNVWQWKSGAADANGYQRFVRSNVEPYSATRSGVDYTTNHRAVDRIGAILSSASDATRHADFSAELAKFRTKQACEEFLGARFDRVHLRQPTDVYIVRNAGQELWVRWNGAIGGCEYGVCQVNGSNPGPARWTPIGTPPPKAWTFDAPDPITGNPSRTKSVDVHAAFLPLLASTRASIAQVVDPARRATAMEAADSTRATKTYLSITANALPDSPIRASWRIPNTPRDFLVSYDRISGKFQSSTNAGRTWTNLRAGTLPFSAEPAEQNPANSILRQRREQRVANFVTETIASGKLPISQDQLRLIGYASQLAQLNNGRLMTSSHGTPMVSMNLSGGDTLYIALNHAKGRTTCSYVVNTPNTPSRFRPLADFSSSLWGVEAQRGNPHVLQVQFAVKALGQIFPATGAVPTPAASAAHVKSAIDEISLSKRFNQVIAYLVTSPAPGISVRSFPADDKNPLPHLEISFTGQLSGQATPQTSTAKFRIGTERVPGRPGEFRPVIQWFDTPAKGPANWIRAGERPFRGNPPQTIFLNHLARYFETLNNR